MVVKAAFLCLTHALIIAIAHSNGDPKYQSHSDGYLPDQPVDEHLKASEDDLSSGGGIEKLQQSQDYLSEYNILF